MFFLRSTDWNTVLVNKLFYKFSFYFSLIINRTQNYLNWNKLEQKQPFINPRKDYIDKYRILMNNAKTTYIYTQKLPNFCTSFGVSNLRFIIQTCSKSFDFIITENCTVPFIYFTIFKNFLNFPFSTNVKQPTVDHISYKFNKLYFRTSTRYFHKRYHFVIFYHS